MASGMMILLNVAAMMERADEALVPAVYAEIGTSFGVGPAALGWLTFVRALVQALASPLAAYLAMSYNRAHVIGLGAVLWAVATALVGLSTTYWQAVIARAVNGVGLAVVVPAIQSLVADVNKEEGRGLAFGWLHASGQLGTVFGGVFATLLGEKQIFGIAGWRFSFIVVAAVSLLLGAVIYMSIQDPNAQSKKKSVEIGELWKDTKSVISLRTFQVIVGQGVVGQIPWNAMLFFTMWLEILGFGHGKAATCVALLSVGNAFGSIFGGWLGDKAAEYSPNGGRIFCSQLSAGVGIPLSAILLLGLPKTVEYAWAYGLVLYSMGFLMSWNSPATNWPILAEIVRVEVRTTVYAVDMAMEKSLAAVGAPLVGELSEIFGFKRDEVDIGNAVALGHGLFLCIALPLFICIFIISILYITYPIDRDAAITSYHKVEASGDVVHYSHSEISNSIA